VVDSSTLETTLEWSWCRRWNREPVLRLIVVRLRRVVRRHDHRVPLSPCEASLGLNLHFVTVQHSLHNRWSAQSLEFFDDQGFLSGVVSEPDLPLHVASRVDILRVVLRPVGFSASGVSPKVEDLDRTELGEVLSQMNVLKRGETFVITNVLLRHLQSHALHSLGLRQLAGFRQSPLDTIVHRLLSRFEPHRPRAPRVILFAISYCIRDLRGHSPLQMRVSAQQFLHRRHSLHCLEVNIPLDMVALRSSPLLQLVNNVVTIAVSNQRLQNSLHFRLSFVPQVSPVDSKAPIPSTHSCNR